MAPRKPAPLEPVGIPEIAARLGVPRATIDVWRNRGQFLAEQPTKVGGGPWWSWPDVAAWWTTRQEGKR